MKKEKEEKWRTIWVLSELVIDKKKYGMKMMKPNNILTFHHHHHGNFSNKEQNILTIFYITMLLLNHLNHVEWKPNSFITFHIHIFDNFQCSTFAFATFFMTLEEKFETSTSNQLSRNFFFFYSQKSWNLKQPEKNLRQYKVFPQTQQQESLAKRKSTNPMNKLNCEASINFLLFRRDENCLENRPSFKT